MTNAKIYSIKFKNKDIINAIKALAPCKAHRYDDIFMRMLKIKPLTILLKNCISQGIFPENCKYNFHKKGHKQIENNYRPASL